MLLVIPMDFFAGHEHASNRCVGASTAASDWSETFTLVA